MKHILCYGDSNTWGYDPVSGGRFDQDTRWAGVLRRVLGAGYAVIEEGLNGRTTVWDDPIEEGKNGKAYLTPCLESHWPLDLVMIMLGTNDLKARFGLTAFDIAQGVCVLASTAQHINLRTSGVAPTVLLLAPPPLGKLTVFAEMFDGAASKSHKLGTYYRAVADERACAFFDTSTVIASSNIDGIHFEKSEHAKLGNVLAGKVRELIGQTSP